MLTSIAEGGRKGPTHVTYMSSPPRVAHAVVAARPLRIIVSPSSRSSSAAEREDRVGGRLGGICLERKGWVESVCRFVCFRHEWHHRSRWQRACLQMAISKTDSRGSTPYASAPLHDDCGAAERGQNLLFDDAGPVGCRCAMAVSCTRHTSSTVANLLHGQGPHSDHSKPDLRTRTRHVGARSSH